jgi:hypothetical protein
MEAIANACDAAGWWGVAVMLPVYLATLYLRYRT